MKEKIYIVKKKLIKNNLKDNFILISQINGNIYIGPKLGKTFCLECYNDKIAERVNEVKNITDVKVIKNIIKIYKHLRQNQIGIICYTTKIYKKYLLPSVKNHRCNIINTDGLKYCCYKNVYGLIDSYKLNKENGLFIYRGVLDIKNISENYLTFSGKAASKKNAMLRFFGEAFERYIPQLYLKRNKYIIENFKIKRILDCSRLDWTQNKMTTIGLSSHNSRLKALKKGFYECIEHISLNSYVYDECKLYQVNSKYNYNSNIKIKQFLIKNEFNIPVILTFSKLKGKFNTFYGIGISSQEKAKKALTDSIYESLQILFEKKYLNLQNSELISNYENIFNSEYPKAKLNNSVFIMDLYNVIRKGYEYSVTLYKSGLRKIHIYNTSIKKNKKRLFELSTNQKLRKQILNDSGF